MKIYRQILLDSRLRYEARFGLFFCSSVDAFALEFPSPSGGWGEYVNEA